MCHLGWQKQIMFFPITSLYAVVRDGIWPKFKPIQAFMHALDTCKKEELPIKMKSLEWPQHFSHYKHIGIFQTVNDRLLHSS